VKVVEECGLQLSAAEAVDWLPVLEQADLDWSVADAPAVAEAVLNAAAEPDPIPVMQDSVLERSWLRLTASRIVIADISDA
jgi:hypothetical protein